MTETTLLSQSIRGFYFSFNRLINKNVNTNHNNPNNPNEENDVKFKNSSIGLFSSDLKQSYQTGLASMCDISGRNM